MDMMILRNCLLCPKFFASYCNWKVQLKDERRFGPSCILKCINFLIIAGVDELYDTVINAVCSDIDPSHAMKAFQDMSPAPINTMCKEQSKADTIKKMEA